MSSSFGFWDGLGYGLGGAVISGAGAALGAYAAPFAAPIADAAIGGAVGGAISGAGAAYLASPGANAAPASAPAPALPTALAAPAAPANNQELTQQLQMQRAELDARLAYVDVLAKAVNEMPAPKAAASGMIGELTAQIKQLEELRKLFNKAA